MAEFLKDSKLTSAIEDLIDNAEEYLYLISPYIKLHDRIKDRLRLKKLNADVHLVVVFGKNEDDATKSLSKDDFEFLKDFPFVTIGYEKRLHAKFYASEDFSIITSMNLHEFSQNNNIEAGIKLKSKKLLSISSDSADADACNYFMDVIDNCTIIFDKEPKAKGGVLGFGSSYSHSEIIADESATFFAKREVIGKKYHQRKPKEDVQQTNSAKGYCIRTGKLIPFDLRKPMCYEAYQSWNQYKNYDFKEKYCHKTGQLSNGTTSMRNPIMN